MLDTAGHEKADQQDGKRSRRPFKLTNQHQPTNTNQHNTMNNTLTFDLTNKTDSLAFARLVASFNQAGVPIEVQSDLLTDGCAVLVTITSGY
jgi:hypothetical protein